MQDFNQGLDQSIDKALHLHGVFGQIVGDLIDMALKQALISPIANSGGFGGILGSIGKLFGVGGGAASVTGGAGVLGSGFDVGSIATGIPFAFANGGSGIIGGKPGIDQNVLSINNTPVAKVGRGETLSVNPNVALSNRRVAAVQAAPTLVSNYHISVSADNAVTPAGFAQGLAQEILREANRMDASRQGQTLNATPGRIQRVQTLGG